MWTFPTVLAAGLAGVAAGIPATALAFSVRAEGAVRMPAQWWLGRPASPWVVAGMSALTGTVAATVCFRLAPSFALPAYWLFGVLAVTLTVVDLRHRRLPHILTGALWISTALGQAAESLASGHILPFAVAAAAGAGATALALGVALALPGQLGFGDVSLSGAIAMSLGWLGVEVAAFGLVAGIVIQALVALFQVVRTHDRLYHLPFGPALLVGWLIALLSPIT